MSITVITVVEQFTQQQPAVKLYSAVQLVQFICELHATHPVEQELHIPDDK